MNEVKHYVHTWQSGEIDVLPEADTSDEQLAVLKRFEREFAKCMPA